MAGPDAQFAWQFSKQPRRRGDRCATGTRIGYYGPNNGVTKFPMSRSPHFSAKHLGHQLHAVADAKHRNIEIEDGRVALRRALVRHAARPARENQADGTFRAKRVDWRVERNDLGIDRQFSKTARDELRVLRAEIEDENRLMRHSQGIGWETLL